MLHRVIAFIKDESMNLSTMAPIIHSIIDYEPLKILKVYNSTCFGHVMSKACQYVKNDDLFFVGLRNVSVKKIHSGLKKPLHGPKSLEKEAKNGSGLVLKMGCDIEN